MTAIGYTYQDLAARWGIDESTVRRWIRRGRLKIWRPTPRTVRVPSKEVEKFEARLITVNRRPTAKAV
jgi:excisionase family DNA binding protein